MKLSESEAKLVRRLQKGQRLWRWARWLHLIVSSSLIVAGLYNIKRLVAMMSDQSNAMFVAFLSPVCWLMLFSVSAWLGFTLGFWNGDPKTKLLLRLLETSENHDA